MHPMLNTAVKAARRAGHIINRAALDLERLKVAKKGPADYVSEIDKMAEEAIISVLQDAYPDHSFLGEESGALGQSDYQWIIDPIDGTTNFIHGFPMYAVSIALAHKGVLTQGVIYDPVKNDLFTATRGAGAYLNERRIRVSQQIKMEDALIGSGFPYSSMENQERYMRMLSVIMRESAGIRRPGSAALDLAYVAAGRYDGFWELGLKPWDMAAGVLLIQEAGGLVTDLDGEQRYLETGHIVAGNPKIFSQLLTLVTKA
ncbi:inositol monophosphatase [Ferrovum sp. PN-J185]|uniref:inositol monophosphatase family protein n=1 Tax=Ferrovum sp. PN-J185 TaxID=1356306 RepID=UPI0007987201|nr:inositol monophosphatase family protein [Ferrovum sp. PN-J185]KXW55291.1 inositol-1-monophosphatase [Ferrovum sp. PN-J185]MCC6068644.1 inositol monophosphatase [Ferrovum sp. PN-J185]MDE1891654.1 inositol monophosphatase [Betaproteobacteria bacterium]MDE2055988.1 inositol monophosphatase [Betaproteobacteria bacterium]